MCLCLLNVLGAVAARAKEELCIDLPDNLDASLNELSVADREILLYLCGSEFGLKPEHLEELRGGEKSFRDLVKRLEHQHDEANHRAFRVLGPDENKTERYCPALS